MPQPTVSKHLRVLRDAGFVESTVDAQRRLYRLRPEPLQEVDAWLAPFRRVWSAHVDALERHLDRMDQSTPTKRKTRRRDRKSTRLNSSHSQISYAVFCLKKKITPQRYPAIAERYRPLTPRTDKHGIELNIPEHYQNVYRTKPLTFGKLFVLVYAATDSFA